MEAAAAPTPASAPIPAHVEVIPPSRRKKIKTGYDAASLAESVASSLVAGSGCGLRTDPKLGPVTEHDRNHLMRITGETVETFNARISERLRTIADLTAQRIIEKLHSDAFKPSELAFVLSVAEDKRTRLDGSHSLQSASVNIQVNNYGSDSAASTKDSLLSGLLGKTNIVRSAEPLPRTEPNLAVSERARAAPGATDAV